MAWAIGITIPLMLCAALTIWVLKTPDDEWDDPIDDDPNWQPWPENQTES